jgi:hypothetical protein
VAVVTEYEICTCKGGKWNPHRVDDKDCPIHGWTDMSTDCHGCEMDDDGIKLVPGCPIHDDAMIEDMDEGFPAPVSQALFAEAQHLRERADKLDELGYIVEDVEAIHAGVSHPAGCILASFLGRGEPQWMIAEGCELPHD